MKLRLLLFLALCWAAAMCMPLLNGWPSPHTTTAWIGLALPGPLVWLLDGLAPEALGEFWSSPLSQKLPQPLRGLAILLSFASLIGLLIVMNRWWRG